MHDADVCTRVRLISAFVMARLPDRGADRVFDQHVVREIIAEPFHDGDER